MALSVIDPKTALIIIDLQKGIVSLPLVHPAAKVVNNARTLADAFRNHGLPVVLVNVAGMAPRANGAASTDDELPAGVDRSHPRVEPTAHRSHDHEAHARCVPEDGPRRASSQPRCYAGRTCGHFHPWRCRIDGTAGI
jgi:nicotinamidase-related amidase